MQRALLRPCAGALRGAVWGVPPAMARRAKGRGWYYRALARMEEEAGREAEPVFPQPPLHGKKRQRAFLDLSMGGEPAGRMVFELADDVVPKTVDNFLRLCEGKAEPPAEPTVAPDAPLTYKGTPINKVWRKFMVLAGDFGGTARGGHSALGSKYFEDENFVGRHTARGTVSMANAGVDTNSSTFFIAAKPMPHLDGRNVVFGHVVEGLELLDKIEATFTQNGEPVNEVVIEDCGAL